MPVYFPSSTASGLPNVFNYSPSTNLTKWRRALARVKSGGGNARLLCVGDSTTFGAGSNGSLLTGNMIPLSYPTLLSGLFNAAGINAHYNSWMGDGEAAYSDHILNDSRMALGTNWNWSSITTLGGNYIEGTANSAGALAFTSTVNTDTCNMWFNPGSTATFTINANGSNSTSFNQATGGGAIRMVTATAPLGANTWNVLSGNAALYVNGMECYDSSKSWVSVMNAGWSTSVSGNWAFQDGNDWDSTTIIQNVLKPDLTIIDLGINEWAASDSVATYTTNMQTVITACAANGDVVIMTPIPSSTGTVSIATQLGFVNAMYTLAAANNLVLIDIYNRWASYTTSNNLGYYLSGNGIHPVGLGYADQARAVMNVIGNP